MNLKTKLSKYYRYIFRNEGFQDRPARGGISEHALQAAAAIRSADRSPAIIIHGIMKRSGTVYTGELLGLHPDIQSHPNKIWETPFLALTGDIRKLQSDFAFAYQGNAGKLGENDFLPIFGAAFIAYMHSYTEPGKRMLLKVPGVEYLDYFFDVFPNEQVMVLLRDGRDLVTSTIKTWPQLRFTDVCRRWANSARMVQRFERANVGRPGYLQARYEDAVHQPEKFVRAACDAFSLDSERFPYDKIADLPVIGSSTAQKPGRSWMKPSTSFNPIGRWQTWSPLRKRAFKRIAGQALIDLGYVPDNDW